MADIRGQAPSNRNDRRNYFCGSLIPTKQSVEAWVMSWDLYDIDEDESAKCPCAHEKHLVGGLGE